MQIRTIFKERFKGLKIEENSREETIEAYTFGVKEVENCIINYHKEGLQTINMRVKDKYFLKEGDIVVATMPSSTSSHVGFFSNNTEDEKVIINRNFVVLRNPIKDFNPEFIAEYLENIGIKESFSKKNKEAFKIEDIEDIDIPEISIDQQEELMKLIHPINQRAKYYNQVIQNDSKIKKYMINEVVNNEE